MPQAARAFFRVGSHGVDLFVRLTPKAAADRIEGVATAPDGSAHLAARVRAVPDKGLANAAVVRLIASELDIAARDVALASGATSRLKTIRITGDPEWLASRLAALYPQA